MTRYLTAATCGEILWKLYTGIHTWSIHHFKISQIESHRNTSCWNRFRERVSAYLHDGTLLLRNHQAARTVTGGCATTKPLLRGLPVMLKSRSLRRFAIGATAACIFQGRNDESTSPFGRAFFKGHQESSRASNLFPISVFEYEDNLND